MTDSPLPAVPPMDKRKPPPKGWEDLECVGGPSCGFFMRIRTTDDSVHLWDGFYIRRHLDATPEQKRDPLWQLVRDVLDWQDDPQPLNSLWQLLSEARAEGAQEARSAALAPERWL